MVNIIIITLVTILANMVGTLSGFGLGTIMTPILLFFLPFTQTILLVAVIHWFHNIWKVYFFRYGIDWKVLLYFGMPSVIGSFFGALLVCGRPENLLFLLGIFLIGYSLFLLFVSKFTLPYTKINALFGGGISGLFAGIFGIRGAIRSAFLSAYNLSKATFLGTTGAISIFIDTTRILVYRFEGIHLDFSLAWGLLLFIPASFIGSYVGRYMVTRVSQEQFRTVVVIFLLLMGMRLVLTPLF